ncbi:MAG: ATP-dependent DNA helicase, partial [Deferribacterales bacterium]
MVIQKYFIENEYLPKIIKNYNYRSYQAEFSEKIYDLLSSYKTVVAEAPTGYGKTFSYLIPIFELGRRTIISTKTKQLMNQILVKDIPNLKKILKGNDLKIASLLGRRNYLCHYRFGKFIVPYRDMYIDVVSWVDNINEDDIILVPNDKFDGEVIGKITADSYQCIGVKCPYINRCSFYNAKDIANNSDIVVTNHHMLLADIAMRIKYDGSYNFDFAEHIVFDEAHSIVDIFPAYLGDELSSYSILNFIKDNRSYLGEDRFKDLYSKWKVLISRHRNTDRLTEKMESDFKKLFDEMDKIFSSYITEEDYSIFQKYRDTFENIYKNDGVKVVENNGDFLSIKNIPISSGDKFVEGLKCSCISSLMISATISFNGSFDYFMGELGLDDTVEKIRLEPPENFMKQGKLFINDYFIDNVEDKKIFYADLMKHLKGATLVIFNNLSHMLEIYR